MHDHSLNHGPQTNDVIIQRDIEQPRRYLVGSFQRRAQLCCNSRGAALVQATSYATTYGVCIWQVDDREEFTLIFSPSMDGENAFLS